MISMQGEGVGWFDRPHLGVVGTVTVMGDIGNSTQNSTRPICACGNPREIKMVLKSGKRSYRGVCNSCRVKRYGRYKGKLANKKRAFRGSVRKLRGSFNDRTCQVCGWVGPCDMHRIIHGKDGGGYNWDNVAVLCPNCHRLHHAGRLNDITSMQRSFI